MSSKAITLPDGTQYTPDPAKAKKAITLPDGTLYTPNPAKAKAAITLVADDTTEDPEPSQKA